MGSTPRGISASRGAAILGISDFSTRLEVFQRIMEEREPGWNTAHGYTPPPGPDSAALRWGTAFETAIIGLAERERGLHIGDREQLFACNDTGENGPVVSMNEAGQENFITCHIDGLYKDPDHLSPGIIHEGKTTSVFSYREKWGEPGTDHIPANYQVQVQHQMLCTGAEEAVVSVLVFPETPDKWEAMGWKIEGGPGEDLEDYWLRNVAKKGTGLVDPDFWANTLEQMGYFHQYTVRANSAVQKKLVEKYRKFWESHVLTGKPPEPENYEDVKRLCPEPKSTLVVPDFIARKLAEYKGITEEGAWAKERKERIRLIVTKYAVTREGTMDEESREKIVFMDAAGEKLGSWSKTKSGSLVFRVG